MAAVDDELNELWEQMSGTPDKRLAIAAVIVAAMIWHHAPGKRANVTLHKAVEYLEAVGGAPQ